MAGQSQFNVVGRIAKITELNGVTKIRVIANYPRKQKDGSYEDDPYSSELSVFGDGRQKYVKDHLDTGDLILSEGRFREENYEKDGETIYGVTFFVDKIQRLARPQTKDDEI